jgi:hypothetical protein
MATKDFDSKENLWKIREEFTDVTKSFYLLPLTFCINCVTFHPKSVCQNRRWRPSTLCWSSSTRVGSPPMTQVTPLTATSTMTSVVSPRISKSPVFLQQPMKKLKQVQRENHILKLSSSPKSFDRLQMTQNHLQPISSVFPAKFF